MVIAMFCTVKMQVYEDLANLFSSFKVVVLWKIYFEHMYIYNNHKRMPILFTTYYIMYAFLSVKLCCESHFVRKNMLILITNWSDQTIEHHIHNVFIDNEMSVWTTFLTKTVRNEYLKHEDCSETEVHP